MSAFVPCAVVPTYENPVTLPGVVEALRAHGLPVIVVDDGSGDEARRVAASLARDGEVFVVHRDRNGGKGAAVKTGLRTARDLGFSHALQVDADGQHDLAKVPDFLERAREAPDALVLGSPVFDASVPRSRLQARRITRFWVDVETGGRVVEDAMVGFRVYPVGAALAAGARGDRMDFDIEIAVRMVWLGTPVVNVRTRVRYLTSEEGGVSHFRMVRDNLRISWLHTRLTTLSILRRLSGLGVRGRRRSGWLDVAERGTVLGIRFFVVLSTVFGRPVARAFLPPIALWYTLTSAVARRASREWLARAEGRRPGLGRVYRHVLTFCQVTLDRLFLARGRVGPFETTTNGHEHLERLVAEGKGALLLGAHLGSFEVLRASARLERFPIHVVAFSANARRLQAVLEGLDPEMAGRVIAIEPEGLDAVMKIRDVVQAGGIVALLGDRVPPGARSVEVDFLGGRVRLPAGPYLVAAVLHCPVYLTFGLYRGGRRYDLSCEPFADPVVLPRGRRDEAAAEYAQRFADRLAERARAAPLNWFNFHDFWSPS